MKEAEIRDPLTHDKYLEMVRQDALEYFSDPSTCEKISCPACNCENAHPQFTKFGFAYVMCYQCRSLYVNPRPKLEYLEDFYSHSPSSRFWAEEFFKPVAEARRIKLFRPRAEFVSKLLGNQLAPNVGDIGAGFGLFLEELKKFAPQTRCTAIEPSPEMAEICRGKGLEVYETIIEKMIGYSNKFDFLCAFELFEHLHTPRTLLEAAFNLLKPGGRLLVTTLNGEGFDIQLLWESSKSVFPPHHLNFCNPESLSMMLLDVGFEIDHAETPGVLDWDIVQGNIQRQDFTPERFWKHLAKHGSDVCKREFQSWLTRNNLSSHMRVIARKPNL